MKEADQAMKDVKEALTEAVQEHKEQDLEKLKVGVFEFRFRVFFLQVKNFR